MSSKSPVTSVVSLPLKSGVDVQQLADASSDVGRSMHKMIQTILAQPGARQVYWSIEVENPSTLRLFAEWGREHEQVVSQEIPTDGGAQFGQHLSGEPVEYHVTFTSPPDVLGDERTGATEVLTVYFPGDLSSDLRDDFHNRMIKLAAVIQDNAEPGQFSGSAGGWSVEKEVPYHDGSGEGLAYVLLIGWGSVQAHMDFRGTQAFKDNIHLILEAPNVVTRRMVHVQCKTVRE